MWQSGLLVCSNSAVTVKGGVLCCRSLMAVLTRRRCVEERQERREETPSCISCSMSSGTPLPPSSTSCWSLMMISCYLLFSVFMDLGLNTSLPPWALCHLTDEAGWEGCHTQLSAKQVNGLINPSLIVCLPWFIVCVLHAGGEFVKGGRRTKNCNWCKRIRVKTAPSKATLLQMKGVRVALSLLNDVIPSTIQLDRWTTGCCDSSFLFCQLKESTKETNDKWTSLCVLGVAEGIGVAIFRDSSDKVMAKLYKFYF